MCPQVRKDAVVCKNKATKEEFVVPSSLTLWSTGVKPGAALSTHRAPTP